MLSIALACSLGLCLVLTVAVIRLLVLQHKPTGLPTYEHPTSSEIIYTPGVRPPILGPEFPLKTKTFIKDWRYIGKPEEVYDMWKPLLFRANNGTISFEGDEEPYYGISGYHQLHCVWLYVEMIDRAVTGVPPNAELEKHTRHCAEYLRQSVMCTADNTLERNYMGVLGAFEANNTHVCRDWDKLMEWADENVYTGAT